MSLKTNAALGLTAVASAAALLPGGTARADTFQTFAVTGAAPITMAGSAPVTSTFGGTVTVDQTTASFSAVSLTATAPIGQTFGTITTQFQGLGMYILDLQDPKADALNLGIVTNDLRTFAGGAAAGTYASAGGSMTSSGVSITFTPTTVPEPASLGLVGTAAAAVLGRRRRRA